MNRGRFSVFAAFFESYQAIFHYRCIPITLTPSMRSALGDLKLEQLIVFYPGSHAYELELRVRVLPISGHPESIGPLQVLVQP